MERRGHSSGPRRHAGRRYAERAVPRQPLRLKTAAPQRQGWSGCDRRYCPQYRCASTRYGTARHPATRPRDAPANPLSTEASRPTSHTTVHSTRLCTSVTLAVIDGRHTSVAVTSGLHHGVLGRVPFEGPRMSKAASSARTGRRPRAVLFSCSPLFALPTCAAQTPTSSVSSRRRPPRRLVRCFALPPMTSPMRPGALRLRADGGGRHARCFGGRCAPMTACSSWRRRSVSSCLWSSQSFADLLADGAAASLDRDGRILLRCERARAAHEAATRRIGCMGIYIYTSIVLDQMQAAAARVGARASR